MISSYSEEISFEKLFMRKSESWYQIVRKLFEFVPVIMHMNYFHAINCAPAALNLLNRLMEDYSDSHLYVCVERVLCKASLLKKFCISRWVFQGFKLRFPCNWTASMQKPFCKPIAHYTKEMQIKNFNSLLQIMMIFRVPHVLQVQFCRIPTRKSGPRAQARRCWRYTSAGPQQHVEWMLVLAKHFGIGKSTRTSPA